MLTKAGFLTQRFDGLTSKQGGSYVRVFTVLISAEAAPYKDWLEKGACCKHFQAPHILSPELHSPFSIYQQGTASYFHISLTLCRQVILPGIYKSFSDAVMTQQ